MTSKIPLHNSDNKLISTPKKIALYSISAIFFTIGLFGFMQVGWLLSTTLSDAERAQFSLKTEIPGDARAYASNHGNYIFFTQTPSDNPKKTSLILLMLIGGIGTSISINSYIVLNNRRATRNNADQINGNS